MSKFKVGDRVRKATFGTDVPAGTLGTVAGGDKGMLMVFWDNGRQKAYTIIPGHDYGVRALVPERTLLTVDAAIASYTLACEAFEAAQLAVEKAKQDVADARLNLRDALDGES